MRCLILQITITLLRYKPQTWTSKISLKSNGQYKSVEVVKRRYFLEIENVGTIEHLSHVQTWCSMVFKAGLCRGIRFNYLRCVVKVAQDRTEQFKTETSLWVFFVLLGCNIKAAGLHCFAATKHSWFIAVSQRQSKDPLLFDFRKHFAFIVTFHSAEYLPKP